MNEHTLDHYERMLDDLGAETIARFDYEESGEQRGPYIGQDSPGTWEHEQSGGCFTFSALDRGEQVAIMRALDANLPTRTARVNGDGPTSYAIKHAVERYAGFYVSNLQCKTAMRILGYVSGGGELNPCYNVSKREWRRFSDRSREIADRRAAAKRRIDRASEAQACARYFSRMAV